MLVSSNISNGLCEETNEQHIFLKYFTINSALNFLYIIFNEKLLVKGNI